ncbi:type IV secretion system protein [Insolitispirillum peregrinum]|nr:type IV secretion system protein [Insolitispirillum peregrinum]
MAKASDFTGNLTEALMPAMLALFMPLAGCWVVVTGIRLLVEPGAVKGTIARDLFIMLLASVLLSGQANGLITDAYTASLDVIAGAAATAFDVAGGKPVEGYEGMSALIAAMESAIQAVLEVAEGITTEGGWSNWVPYLLAALLVFPFILMVVIYLAHVVVALFRIVSITAMVPLLALFLGFSWGRQMAVAGIKGVIGSGLVLYTCTLAMALSVQGVTSLKFPTAEDNLGEFASFSNPEMLMAIAMGFLGIAMMREATGLANMISGLLLQDGGQQMIVNAAKGASKASARGAIDLASLAGKSVSSASQMASDRVARWRNPNQ